LGIGIGEGDNRTEGVGDLVARVEEACGEGVAGTGTGADEEGNGANVDDGTVGNYFIGGNGRVSSNGNADGLGSGAADEFEDFGEGESFADTGIGTKVLFAILAEGNNFCIKSIVGSDFCFALLLHGLFGTFELPVKGIKTSAGVFIINGETD